MERYQELRESSKKNLSIADHMLTMTYPLLKDSKLLPVVLDNIFLALTNSIGALLYYDRLYKRVPPFQNNFTSKFNMFQAKVVGRYKIPKEYVAFIQQVKDILLQHKKSPVEFARQGAFVICDSDYKMKSLTVEQMREYLLKTKDFVIKMEKIIANNEKLFNKVVVKGNI